MRASLLVFFLVAVTDTICLAAPRVHFDQSQYDVAANESFQMQVLIDADDETVGDQALAEGLFSYGILVEFDAENAMSVGPMSVPTELSYFGFDEGAFHLSRGEFVGSKGNIDLRITPAEFYQDNLLASVTLTNLAPPMSEYEVSLSLFRTLGPTEQVFVDGAGQVLDTELVFGSARVSVAGGILGDVDLDGELTVNDIDRICAVVRGNAAELSVDFNGDQRVDADDVRFWVEEIKLTYVGDSNLDGEFNSADLVAVFTEAEYEDDVPLNSTWADGDWDCSGDFTSSDIVSAFISGGYELGPRDAAVLVPEPPADSVAALGFLSMLLLTRVTWRGGNTCRCMG